MEKSYAITGGLYLVLDPSLKLSELLRRVEEALVGGVEILQIWNHWPGMFPAYKKDVIESIIYIAEDFDVPVLINEEWELLKTTNLHGIHFDQIPDNYDQIKTEIGRTFLAGITCGNDLNVIRWAHENQLDYVSFCSMFPSTSAGSCEIVRPEMVKKAKEITDIPLFLSGGINKENMKSLDNLDFEGIAVISGIMNARYPAKSAQDYAQTLKKMRIKDEKDVIR